MAEGFRVRESGVRGFVRVWKGWLALYIGRRRKKDFMSPFLMACIDSEGNLQSFCKCMSGIVGDGKILNRIWT